MLIICVAPNQWPHGHVQHEKWIHLNRLASSVVVVTWHAWRYRPKQGAAPSSPSPWYPWLLVRQYQINDTRCWHPPLTECHHHIPLAPFYKSDVFTWLNFTFNLLIPKGRFFLHQTGQGLRRGLNPQRNAALNG